MGGGVRASGTGRRRKGDRQRAGGGGGLGWAAVGGDGER